MNFIELTQVVSGEIFGKVLINISDVLMISKNGNKGTLIEFGKDEYITVEESYSDVKRQIKVKDA